MRLSFTHAEHSIDTVAKFKKVAVKKIERKFWLELMNFQ